jgi:hypothetical protein
MNVLIGDWISVAESLPTETDRYWVKTDKGKVFNCWFVCDISGKKDWGVSCRGLNIAFWKPLIR